MIQAALLSSLMAVCAWISIPIPPVAFTLQTFAVLLSLGLLGGRWGTVSILIYLLLGIVGLPVFSGFQTGAAALSGPTAGFLWGFLGAGLTYWLLQRLGRLPAMVGAQVTVYLGGCLWFCLYAGSPGLWTGLLVCVVPYLIPDGIKLTLAWLLSRRIRKRIQ